MENKEHEVKQEAIQKETTTDPLLGTLEEQIEDDFETDLEEVEDISETDFGTYPENEENEEESDLDDFGTHQEDDTEDLPEDEEEDDIPDPIAYVSQSENDPLGGMGAKEEPKTAQDYIKDKDNGAAFAEKLKEWGLTAVEYLDDAKVQLCVALGGGHPSEYAADKKVRKMFFEATEELLKSKEIKPPTPMQAFLFALAMMVVPALGMAAFRRFVVKKEAKPLPQKQEASALPQAQTDYKSTKEFQSGRARFKVFASTGAYQYDVNGNYIEIKFADDYPSPEVQKLIDEGRTSSEIKDIIYGE